MLAAEAAEAQVEADVAAVVTASQSTESATAFLESMQQSYGFPALGVSSADDSPGTREPDLEELFHQISTLVGHAQGDALLSLSTNSISPEWPPKGEEAKPAPKEEYDGFDISLFIDDTNLAEEETGDEIPRASNTPELVNTGSSQGPTPTSILESPASGNHHPLEASPKGLRASATGGDKPIGGFGFDFHKEIGIPEGPHYHRSVQWRWDGEMEGAGEWPITYDGHVVSSTA